MNDGKSIETPLPIDPVPIDPVSKNSLGIYPEVVQVNTRSNKSALHPLVLPNIEPLNINKKDFIELQQNCPTLKQIRDNIHSGEQFKSRNGRSYIFILENELIYRKCVSSCNERDINKLNLVVPKSCRPIVLKLAHDLPVSGHFSNRKTEMKVCNQFWWPGVSGDIRRYCQSCDQCQRMSICGRTPKAPMTPMPIISTPFQRIAIDLVGKISPPSNSGHQFILTIIDYATCFLEAVPLKEITSIAVAEALMTVFSRVGVPREVISDRGAQFTSDLMNEIHKLIGIKPIFTTPYHPMTNGRIEKSHSTLKLILRKLCEKKPRDWDRYLIPTLFAMREIPSDTTGFSPFELLYGRQVRGPLSILNELWCEPAIDDETRNSYQNVLEIRERLEEASELAVSAAKLKSASYKTYFDRKTANRSFKVNDEVLLLLPDSSNKLLMRWQGPYKVVEVKSKLNYVLDIKGKHKLYHINLLKRYFRRATVHNLNIMDEAQTLDSVGIPNNIFVAQICTIDENDENSRIFTPPDNHSCESYSISDDLNRDQHHAIESILTKYSENLSNIPGCTSTINHKIQLKSTEIVCRRNYPIPIHLKPYFDMEVDKMIEMGIIQPSTSNFCSPSVLVKKADTNPIEYRLTQDFRALNAITIFDAEPMPAIDSELYKFANARFISEVDITRAYYQIPLSPESRKYTAFSTSKGLMEYLRLPFGLVTACATYVRLMRRILSDIDPNLSRFISVYFDNIYIATEDFNTHLNVLDALFACLEKHNLTAKPSKCSFACKRVNYLGFIIGDGSIQPQPSKVEAISNMTLPKNKKELRSFLGFVGFYRKFIPNMSDLSATLSNMLKKEAPDKLIWSDTTTESFDELKYYLRSSPILHLPDLNKKFCIRTDASGIGIAAMLIQYHDDMAKPVCYASRKLLPRETRYSTIERECLALVWGISKFDYYLYGREFLIETDHKPLTFLKQFKCSNPRLMRWALSLQMYQFTVIYIPGSENHGPDVLSRCVSE